MTDTSALRAFIEARLNEDEYAAQRAGWEHPVWTYNREVFVVASDGWCIAARKDDGTPINDVDGTHIARHDPARVLREVAAKRAILIQHQTLQVEGDPITGCTTCSWRDHYDELQGEYPCETLRALASVWSDHPDYRPSWAPA